MLARSGEIPARAGYAFEVKWDEFRCLHPDPADDASRPVGNRARCPFFPLVFAAAVVPIGAALGFVCAPAGGAAALVAIVRDASVP
jgi:hypothetical protein